MATSDWVAISSVVISAGVALIYIGEFIVIIKSLILRRFKRPVLTMKAMLLIFLSLGVLWGLFSLKLIQQEFLWLLLLLYNLFN